MDGMMQIESERLFFGDQVETKGEMERMQVQMEMWLTCLQTTHVCQTGVYTCVRCKIRTEEQTAEAPKCFPPFQFWFRFESLNLGHVASLHSAPRGARPNAVPPRHSAPFQPNFPFIPIAPSSYS